jgi:hypothetical protein
LIPIIGDSRLCTPHGHTHTPGEDAPVTTTGAAHALDLDAAAVHALYRTLCGPGIRFLPLRYRGENLPADHRAPVGAADTVAAALHDGWALVAPLAHDFVVLDLDGCAIPEVLRVLDATATAHGAMLAYRAASGSPNSEHRAYALPARRRAAFREAAVKAAAVGHAPGARWDMDDRTADQRTSNLRRGNGLRLPGSVALKPGGLVCWPLRADGTPVLDLAEADRMARAARTAAGLPPVPASAAPVAVDQTPVAPAHHRDVEAPLQPPVGTSAPRRAYSCGIGGEFTVEEQAVLDARPARGQRSDAALTALFIVVHRCGTDWSAVREVVLSAPAFHKFTRRGEARARRWWDREAARRVEHLKETKRHPARPVATAEEQEAVLQWLDTAYTRLWARYPLSRASRAYSAALFIGERRLLDGRGLQGRPVAVRDLVQWGAASSPMTASRALADLVDAGVVVLDTDYSVDNPLQARRWSVPGDLLWAGASAESGTCRRHTEGPTLTPSHLRALTHPSLDWLPVRLRASLQWLLLRPLRASALGSLLRCSLRSARALLVDLQGAGLVRVDAGGCWSAVLDAANVAPADAVGRLDAARERVSVDRVGWHRLWRRCVDAAGRLRWQFCPWRRPARAGAPAGSVSGVVRRRRGLQGVLPGLDAVPGAEGAGSVSAVLPRSGRVRADSGAIMPWSGSWPDGDGQRLRRAPAAGSVNPSKFGPAADVAGVPRRGGVSPGVVLQDGG